MFWSHPYSTRHMHVSTQGHFMRFHKAQGAKYIYNINWQNLLFQVSVHRGPKSIQVHHKRHPKRYVSPNKEDTSIFKYYYFLLMMMMIMITRLYYILMNARTDTQQQKQQKGIASCKLHTAQTKKVNQMLIKICKMLHRPP